MKLVALHFALALTTAMSCLIAAPSACADPDGLMDTISYDGFDPDPGPGPTQSCPFTADANGFFTLNSPMSSYVVRLPVGYSVQNPRPKPLIVALHGCGDAALNFATWAAAPAVLRPAQSYIAVSLGGRDGACWTLNTDDTLISAAIAHLRSCFYANQKRTVIAGYSQGGMLAYKVGLTNSLTYAGVLIENSGLSQAVGAGNVDTILNAAAWKINVAHTARLQDDSFPIAGVQSDRDKLLAHAFPLQYRELVGTNEGDSDDWASYLIPAMAQWTSP